MGGFDITRRGYGMPRELLHRAPRMRRPRKGFSGLNFWIYYGTGTSCSKKEDYWQDYKDFFQGLFSPLAEKGPGREGQAKREPYSLEVLNFRMRSTKCRLGRSMRNSAHGFCSVPDSYMGEQQPHILADYGCFKGPKASHSSGC